MNFSEIFKEKIQEPAEELQERLRQQWLSLNTRERLILSSLASLVVLLLSVLIIKEAFSFFSRHENRVQETMNSIGDIQELSAEIGRQKIELGRYERLKAKRGSDFKIASFLENESRKFGVTVEKASPTKSKSTTATADEDWMELKLGKDTNLDAALKFLQSIEEPLGVRIVELTIKPQFADPTKLEVLAIVAAQKEI